jgi:hypothetical protein
VVQPLAGRELERLAIAHRAMLHKGLEHITTGIREGTRTLQMMLTTAVLHNYDCEDFMKYIREFLQNSASQRLELVLASIIVKFSRRYNNLDKNGQAGDRFYAWGSEENSFGTLPSFYTQNEETRKWLLASLMPRARNLMQHVWKRRTEVRDLRAKYEQAKEQALQKKLDDAEAEALRKLAAHLAVEGGWVGVTEEERRRLRPAEMLIHDMISLTMSVDVLKAEGFTHENMSNQMRIYIIYMRKNGGMPPALRTALKDAGFYEGIDAAALQDPNYLPLFNSNAAKGKGKEVKYDLALSWPEKARRFLVFLQCCADCDYPRAARRKRKRRRRLVEQDGEDDRGASSVAAAAAVSSPQQRKAKKSKKAKDMAKTPHGTRRRRSPAKKTPPRLKPKKRPKQKNKTGAAAAAAAAVMAAAAGTPTHRQLLSSSDEEDDALLTVQLPGSTALKVATKPPEEE